MSIPAGRPQTGAILLFVHGFLDSAQCWQRAIRELDGHGLRGIAVDLQPAADASSSAATLESYAGQVVSRIREEAAGGLRPVVIIGHSMGGAVAELAAIAIPDILAGLVLITPAPLSGYPLNPEQRSDYEARARHPDAAATGTAKRARSLNLDDQGLAILVSSTLATAPDFAIEQFNAWTGGHPYGNAPSLVETPVLLLTSDDRTFSHSFLVKEVASRFDFVRVQRIKGAGHWPQLERSFETVRGISSFVGEVTETISRPPRLLQSIKQPHLRRTP